MNRTIIILLLSNLVNCAFAQSGMILRSGPTEIHLNEKPVSSIMARGKTNELEDELTDGQRIKTPELPLTEEQYDFLAGNIIGTRDIPLEQALELKKKTLGGQQAKNLLERYG